MRIVSEQDAQSAAASVADLVCEASALRDRVTALTEALERSVVALDDWLHLHAADQCYEQDVSESRQRVNRLGTIGYIATVQEQNRLALYRGEEET